MFQKKVIDLSLKTDPLAAREVAEAVMLRANPHESDLVAREFEEDGINVESMARYFTLLARVVEDFWYGKDHPEYKVSFRPYEVQSLYLPVIMATIYSQVGTVTVGNYTYHITPSGQEISEAERDFIIEFSSKLEKHRHRIKGSTKQIGNYNAQPSTVVMMTILGAVSELSKSARVYFRDGMTYDDFLLGISALAGVSLVEETASILYTGVEEVSFRGTVGAVIEKGAVAITADENQVAPDENQT